MDRLQTARSMITPSAASLESDLQPRSPPPTDVLVGRQPIFDRALKVVAYELLYRTGDSMTADVTDGGRATATVLVNAFLEIGLDTLVGTHRAYVNLTGDLLNGEAILALPPERVTLEVLETVTVDPLLVEAVRRLAARGYQIALDDFVYDRSWDALVGLAHVAKLDVRALSREALVQQVLMLKRRGLTLLAEKVETQDEFSALLALGFDLFQGYFFERPQIVSGRTVPSSQLALLRLMAALADAEVDAAALEPLVSADAALSYKLIRYLNSPAIGLPRRIHSIRTAITFFGIVTLKRWAMLLAMGSVEGKPPELLRVALLRARACEQLASRDDQVDPNAAFTVGLFSILDALVDRPMAEILAELPLGETICSALLSGAGPAGEYLTVVRAAERADWSGGPGASLDAHTVQRVMLEAIAFADRFAEQAQ